LDKKKSLYMFWVVLFLLNFLDVFFTSYGVEVRVLTEDNPISAIFLKNGIPAIFIFKYFMVFTLLTGVVMLERKVDLLLMKILITAAIGISFFFNLKHLEWLLVFFF